MTKGKTLIDMVKSHAEAEKLEILSYNTPVMITESEIPEKNAMFVSLFVSIPIKKMLFSLRILSA